jgi:Spy/CpxP family protein refolding chaperone
MQLFNKVIAIGALALAISGATQLNAQQDQGGRRRGGPGGGNFDPAQMRERMMERYKEVLEVKDDAEWKVISERIDKVLEARREVGVGGFGNMFRRPPGGDNNAADNNRRRFGAENLPEAESLQKSLESKASADEVKAKLAKLRDARKAKEEALNKTQEDLRKVLTARQEAQAVLNGLLK